MKNRNNQLQNKYDSCLRLHWVSQTNSACSTRWRRCWSAFQRISMWWTRYHSYGKLDHTMKWFSRWNIYNYVISTNSDCLCIHYQTFESCCERLVQLTLETGNMRFQHQSHVQIFPWVPACDYRNLKWHRHECKIDMFLRHSFIMYTSFCQLSVTTAEEPYIYIRIYYI